MTTTVASAIIQKAYQNAGKVARGLTPSPVQLLDALSTLSDIIAFEVTKGLKLWLETEVTVSLVAGRQAYSFRPGGDVSMVRPLKIKEASYVASGGAVRALTPVSREEWNRQPNRSGSGQVTQYFSEKLYDRLNLYCWLTPDTVAATGHLLVVLANQGSLPLTVTSDTRFPPEWSLFLQWRLGQELATGMPQEITMRCDQMALTYREHVEAFDVEEAPTRFAIDTQAQSWSKFS